MNKAELIDVLAGRLGDRTSATKALDAMLTEIQNAVTKGDKVSLTGFGVFERRERGPRIARNPRTGESVRVGKTSVPAFRPGSGFRDVVAAGRPSKATAAATAKKTVAKAGKKTAAKAAPKPATKAVKKTAARKATPAKKSTRAATSPAGRRTTGRTSKAARRS